MRLKKEKKRSEELLLKAIADLKKNGDRVTLYALQKKTKLNYKTVKRHIEVYKTIKLPKMKIVYDEKTPKNKG